MLLLNGDPRLCFQPSQEACPWSWLEDSTIPWPLKLLSLGRWLLSSNFYLDMCDVRTASAKILQMHVFQGDADIWLSLKSFCVQDCSGKSKQNRVRSLSWKPSVVITALVHGALRLTHRWADGLSSWENYVRSIESPKTQSQWWLLLLFYLRDKNNQINLTLL